MDLSLEIEQNTSLTSCLRNFSSMEMLDRDDKFFCDHCGCLQASRGGQPRAERAREGGRQEDVGSRREAVARQGMQGHARGWGAAPAKVPCACLRRAGGQEAHAAALRARLPHPAPQALQVRGEPGPVSGRGRAGVTAAAVQDEGLTAIPLHARAPAREPPARVACASVRSRPCPVLRPAGRGVHAPPSLLADRRRPARCAPATACHRLLSRPPVPSRQHAQAHVPRGVPHGAQAGQHHGRRARRARHDVHAVGRGGARGLGAAPRCAAEGEEGGDGQGSGRAAGRKRGRSAVVPAPDSALAATRLPACLPARRCPGAAQATTCRSSRAAASGCSSTTRMWSPSRRARCRAPLAPPPSTDRTTWTTATSSSTSARPEPLLRGRERSGM
jgi:hypothetical protein